MKYWLDIKIEPCRHYIKVKCKITDKNSDTFYLNGNFDILSAYSDGNKIAYKMDKTAPHPDFDNVSYPVIFNTEADNIEIEYEGFITEIIADINQIDEDIIELASYSGWYPKSKSLKSIFMFDIRLTLPDGYELISNVEIHDYSHIISTSSQDDIVIFASNKIKRYIFNHGDMKLIFLAPEDMCDGLAKRASDTAEANRFFTEHFGDIFGKSGKNEIVSVFRPRGGWGYKRGNASFMSCEWGKNETKFKVDFHELAHSWWGIADCSSNDWINEGGAEFSAFSAAKYIYGEQYACSIIQDYISQIRKSVDEEAIVDSTPDSQYRYLNHYIKTTVMFVKACEQFGEKSILDLLKKLYVKFAAESNATTNEFLNLCNPDMRDFFAKLLFEKGWKKINL